MGPKCLRRKNPKREPIASRRDRPPCAPWPRETRPLGASRLPPPRSLHEGAYPIPSIRHRAHSAAQASCSGRSHITSYPMIGSTTAQLPRPVGLAGNPRTHTRRHRRRRAGTRPGARSRVLFSPHLSLCFLDHNHQETRTEAARGGSELLHNTTATPLHFAAQHLVSTASLHNVPLIVGRGPMDC